MVFSAREYRQQRIAEAKECLGNKCVLCGVEDNLEFDHIDASTKLFNIGRAYDRPAELFWVEIAKCQLLCGPHHRAKTANERGKIREVDVRYIRCLIDMGHSQRNVAKEFAISRGAVRGIVEGRNWRHVT